MLPALRQRERPVVCEIGAGWGGFAYQFKTLFPNAHLRHRRLSRSCSCFRRRISATCFPTRAWRLSGAEDGAADVQRRGFRLRAADAGAAARRSASRTSLVNMVSFQEMTDAQVRRYAEIAASAGCPFIYSFNRERSAYNTELIRVSDALAEHYRLTEVPGASAATTRMR